MKKKVVDLIAYKLEKSLKENGFEVKKDKDNNIMMLIKLSNDESV